MWRLWARPATKTFMLTCSCKGAIVVRSRWGSPGWMSKDPFEKGEMEIGSGIQPGTVFFHQFFGCGSFISPPQRGRDNHLQQDPWRESHHPDKFQHPSSKRFRIINTQSLKTQALRRSSMENCIEYAMSGKFCPILNILLGQPCWVWVFTALLRQGIPHYWRVNHPHPLRLLKNAKTHWIELTRSL